MKKKKSVNIYDVWIDVFKNKKVSSIVCDSCSAGGCGGCSGCGTGS
jgi:hypothetical protein